jgi:hypothetical protein
MPQSDGQRKMHSRCHHDSALDGWFAFGFLFAAGLTAFSIVAGLAVLGICTVWIAAEQFPTVARILARTVLVLGALAALLVFIGLVLS